MAADASSIIYGSAGTGIGGLKEDFEGLIPWGGRGVPIWDLIPEGKKATNYNVETDTESIEARTDKAIAFGADFTFGAQNETSKISNYVGQFAETWELGEEVDDADLAGRKSEAKRRQVLAVEQLLRGQELAICTNATKAAGSSGTAATVGGFPYWVTSNTFTPTSLTEDDLVDAMQAIAEHTERYDTQFIVAGRANIIRACQKFTNASDSDVRFELKSGALNRKLTSLVTAFGTAIFVPCGSVAQDVAWVLDMPSWEQRFMGKSGIKHIKVNWPDGQKGQSAGLAYQGAFTSKLTLICKDEKRNAKITVTP